MIVADAWDEGLSLAACAFHLEWEVAVAVLEINGLAMHHSWRAGAKPPIVFANSLGTDFRVWDHLVPEISHGHGMMFYDKRGHGLSSINNEAFTIDDLADDLARLMDHYGLRDAILCGLSIGGLIVQALAATRPDLVRAIILMDTGHKIGTAEIWNGRIEAIEAKGLAAISEGTMERWFTAEFRTSRPLELLLWRNMLTRTPEAGYLGCARAIRDADFTASTSQLKMPSLCIVGDQDGSTPPELGRELASLIPGSQFEIIKHAGHLPCVEQPRATASLINEFITNPG
jgi:3-oxoadipate enol-lactonase